MYQFASLLVFNLWWTRNVTCDSWQKFFALSETQQMPSKMKYAIDGTLGSPSCTIRLRKPTKLRRPDNNTKSSGGTYCSSSFTVSISSSELRGLTTRPKFYLRWGYTLLRGLCKQRQVNTGVRCFRGGEQRWRYRGSETEQPGTILTYCLRGSSSTYSYVIYGECSRQMTLTET